jgi:hypothetical protein
MIVCWRGQRQRLGIGSRQNLAAATFLAVVVAAIAPGSTLAVAAATPTALGDTIFFMKLLDKPTIVGIVGVLLVENAVAATSTLVAFGAVPTALLMIWLCREDSSLLSLGVLGLWLWGRRLRQVMCRCSGYRGIPVHLLLGPFIGPSLAQGRISDPSYGEDPHEEAPHEENDDRNC